MNANPFSPALVAGALSGIAGLLTFLVIHHFWIKPIWFILPFGLLIAVLGGVAVGWAYAELMPSFPTRPWTVLLLIFLIGVILFPTLLLAELREPFFVMSTAADGSIELIKPMGQVVWIFVLELMVAPVFTGGLVGWLIGRTPRAALATALAGFIFALGPGHNIPFMGLTPLNGKGNVLLLAIVVVSSFVLVQSHVWIKKFYR